MIPIVTNAHNKALDLSDDLVRQAQCLQDPMWDEFFEDSLITEVEASPRGLVITPCGSPFSLLSVLNQFGLTFSRERDESGLYQWVTQYEEFNIQLWIVANENIDLTGSVVTLDSQYNASLI